MLLQWLLLMNNAVEVEIFDLLLTILKFALEVEEVALESGYVRHDLLEAQGVNDCFDLA